MPATKENTTKALLALAGALGGGVISVLAYKALVSDPREEKLEELGALASALAEYARKLEDQIESCKSSLADAHSTLMEHERTIEDLSKPTD